MSWIFIGMLAGSLVTSTHESKEACEGRKVTLTEKGVSGQCVQAPSTFSTWNGSGSIVLTPNNTIPVR